MLADLKHTIKQSAIYGLSRVSTKLIAFILLPIITLKLNVNEYGLYVLTESFWQILWAIYLFGLESGIVRWYLEITDQVKRKRFTFTVFIFILLLNVILNCAALLLNVKLSSLVFDNPAYPNLIFYASLIATAETFLFIVFLLLRIEEKAKSYTVFAVLSSLLSLLLQVYFLIYTNNKLEGIFIAKAAAPALVVFAMIPFILKRIKIGFEPGPLKDLLKYSLPIMAASLIITLLNQVDRNILGYITDLENVGIYGLANNIAGLVNFLVISPFALTFTVLSWKKLNDDNAKRFYTKNITYLFFAVVFISLGISLFTPHLIKIITLKTDYWKASLFVPWNILTMPFYGIHFIGVFSFYVTKKTKYVLYSYLTALIAKVVLDIIIIPVFGIYGASFVNVLSFMILAVTIYIFSKNNYFFRYEWFKVILMIIVYIASTAPFFIFNFENRFIEIILKFIVFILFPFILYLFKFYEPIEIERIRGFINKYLIKVKAT